MRKSELCENQHEQEEHHDEMCTPFCVCSCCATHVVMKSFQPVLKQVAFIHTAYTVLPESKTSAAILPIWQPPKVS